MGNIEEDCGSLTATFLEFDWEEGRGGMSHVFFSKFIYILSL